MASKLRCPACRVTFPWDPAKGFPEFCPNTLCETRIAHDREDSDVVMPFVRTSAKTKVIDRTYREMETASEHRAIAAAEMAGVPVSEMSDLKITNLRSTTHEGDVAAVPVNNEVSRFMDQTGAGGFNAPNPVEYGTNVQVGPYPNAGAHMRTAVQAHHSRSVPGGVSERPANETLQPGYRRRG